MPICSDAGERATLPGIAAFRHRSGHHDHSRRADVQFSSMPRAGSGPSFHRVHRARLRVPTALSLRSATLPPAGTRLALIVHFQRPEVARPAAGP